MHRTRRDLFYKYGILAIVFLGVLVRCFAFFRNISFWGDEAALALNVMNKSYLELFKGLDYLQVAPPMFLVISKFLYRAVNPLYDCMRDILFRQISVVSGIAAIPLFYYLIKQFSKDKLTLLAGMLIFTFNTTTILYCAQFKQYSFELLISIILMIIFFNIIFKNKNRWYYSAIIALSPWFSLSSLFIIGAYFLILLFKSPKTLLKTCIPFVISFIIFYFFSLKPVSDYNYDGMYLWWQNGYGFVSLLHPMRTAIRFGELFSFNKLTAECIGTFILTLAFCSIFPVNKESREEKIFIFLPIILTFLASALKLYPIEARLILFLFPLFVIAISEYRLRFRTILLIAACVISLLSSIYYTINPYKFYTSAAEVVHYTESRIKDGEHIILDSAFHRYLYYIKNKDRVIYLKNGCGEDFIDACNSEIENLPPGIYYLILKNNPEEKLTAKINILEEYNLYSSVIKFAK